jgi:mRNA interferase MazF
MVAEAYVPDRGDIIWLDFNPQRGHEQSGRRPSITISPLAYNRRVGLGLFCPITSRIKGYPFEVRCEGSDVDGVILADQVKSFDWRKRRISYIERATENAIAETLKKILSLIQ